MALPTISRSKHLKQYKISEGPSHTAFGINLLGPSEHRDDRIVEFTIDGVPVFGRVIAAMPVPYPERNVDIGEWSHIVFYIWVEVMSSPYHPIIRSSHELEGRYRTDNRTGWFQMVIPSRKTPNLPL